MEVGKSAIIILMLLLYCGFMVFVTWLGHHRQKGQNVKEFLTAGKEGNLWTIASAYLGDHVGTGIVIGGATYGATVGIGGSWYGLGAAFSFFLFGLVVAGWARSHDYVTIPAYLRDRYAKTGKLMTLIWVFLTACVGIVTLTGQIIAGRQLFEFLGVDPLLGTIIAVVVILLYCSITGMWGVLTLGFWQAVIIIAGLVIAIALVFGGGGITAMRSDLSPDYFNMFPFDVWTMFTLIVPTAVFGLTSNSCVQLSASSKDKKTAIGGALLGGVFVVFVTFLPVILGMYGAAIYPEADTGSIIFTVIMDALPAPIAGLLMAAIIAAVMSTCDTALMTFATCTVYDAYGNVLAPKLGHKPTEKNMRLACGIMPVVAMLIAMVLSFTSNDIIGVLTTGYSLFVAGAVVPFLAGRAWKGTSSVGALASMIAGAGCAWLDLLGVIALPTTILSLIPSLIAVVVFSLIFPDKE